MPKLILVRGIPGSGKSTKAKSFGIFHLESDMFFMQDGEYTWSSHRIKQAHEWCFNTTKSAMCRKMDVVVSNTFTQFWEFEKYIELAKEFKYDLEVIRAVGNFENTHSVPEESLTAMRNRFEDYEGEVIYDPSKG